MTRRRRHYSREFKLQALALLESSGRQVREIEQELGIGSGCLSHWRRELAGQSASSEPAAEVKDKERIRALERELVIARQERDILKKAVAIFSQKDA